jgi:uncharacterized protein with von Willebrand factor type A (vWA) domain
MMCRGRPLLAVESAARTTAALWPLLRWPELDPDQPPPEPAQEALDGLAALAGGDDPTEVQDDLELEALAQRVQDIGGVDKVGDLFADTGSPGIQGALEADEVARHLEQFLPGVGWSSAPGQLEHSLLGKLDQLAGLIQQLPQLRKLADRLGRVEGSQRKAGNQQGGREEVAGVRLGGDISTVLPVELALLGDGDTEDLFYQRFVEHRLLSLELSGRGDDGVSEGDRRGPVIACIDTSASMEGESELLAKAVVLSVTRRILPEGRVLHLLLFGGPHECLEIRLRRGRGGLEGLLVFLEQAFHGGTDFDGPLIRALELLEERDLQRADILIVTDGLGRVAPTVVDDVQAARESRGVRVYAVLVGRKDARGVTPVADEVQVIGGDTDS